MTDKKKRKRQHEECRNKTALRQRIRSEIDGTKETSHERRRKWEKTGRVINKKRKRVKGVK
jgi:hypothetical protein